MSLGLEVNIYRKKRIWGFNFMCNNIFLWQAMLKIGKICVPSQLLLQYV